MPFLEVLDLTYTLPGKRRLFSDVKFKLAESLAYLSRSLLVRGEQKRDRQHNNETTCPACLQQDYGLPRWTGSLAA